MLKQRCTSTELVDASTLGDAAGGAAVNRAAVHKTIAYVLAFRVELSQLTPPQTAGHSEKWGGHMSNLAMSS